MRRNTRANTERPTNHEQLLDLIEYAATNSRTIVPGGAGYDDDTDRNTNEILLDLSHFGDVHWGPGHESIRVEAGVTIDKLWRTVIGKGKWLDVFPLRMDATIGECLSLNSAGATAWHAGSIGSCVSSFDLLLPSKDIITVTLRNNEELFYSVIGGLGMLGVITSITLKVRPIRSDRLRMCKQEVNSLSEMFDIFADESVKDGYLIGSINGHAREDGPGFGVVICGDLAEEDKPDSLLPCIHGLPARLVEFVSSSLPTQTILPLFDLVNAKMNNKLLRWQSSFRRNGRERQIPLRQFHFPFGLMNYSLRSKLSRESYLFQPFVPIMQAERVFTDLLELSHQAGFVPLWCIMRKHRADSFSLSCQIDGFSLELAYRTSPNDVARLNQLLQDMLNRVIEAGGRLNLAQDRILDAPTFKNMMGKEKVERFLEMKKKYDGDNIFQANLFRRLFKVDE